MGRFFSTAQNSPDLGSVLSSWASERNAEKQKEAVKGFGNEMMNFINTLPPEQQSDINVLKQGEAAIAKKYDLDIQGRKMAMGLITDHLKMQYEQDRMGQQKIQNEQSNFLFNNQKEDILDQRKDKNILDQISNPQPLGGDAYSVPSPDKQALTDLLSYSGKKQLQSDDNSQTLFNLQKQSTQANLDNANYLRTRRPVEDKQKDSLFNMNKTILEKQSTDMSENDQVKKVLDEISAMGGRGDYKKLLSNQPLGVQRKVNEILAGSKAKSEEKYLTNQKTEAEIALKKADAISKLRPKSTDDFEKNKKAGDLILKQADRILEKYKEMIDGDGQPIAPENVMRDKARSDDIARKDWEAYTQLKKKADFYYDSADSTMSSDAEPYSSDVDLSEFDAGAPQKKQEDKKPAPVETKPPPKEQPEEDLSFLPETVRKKLDSKDIGSPTSKRYDTRGLFSDIGSDIQQKLSWSQPDDSTKFGEKEVEKAIRLAGGPDDLRERKNIADMLRKEYPKLSEKELSDMIMNFAKTQKG